VKSNKGAAGMDQVDIDTILEYGEERFLLEVELANSIAARFVRV
jgi:hypothetical protein